MKKLIFAALFLCCAGRAEDRHARIFEIGKTDGAPLYTQDTHIDDMPGGSRHWVSKISDPAGKVVMTEEAEFKDGHVLWQKVEQRQIGEAYELEISDGTKGVFKTFKVEGETRTELSPPATETLKSDFVTGPVSDVYLRDHKAELLKGKSVYAHFGIFELQRSVEFEFFKKGSDDKSLRIRMEPANFFVSMLVDPIDLYFDPNDMRLVRYKGRTPLRKRVGDKWKPLDAEILYP